MRPDDCLPPEFAAKSVLAQIKLTSKIDNADDADNVMKRIKAVERLIAIQKADYETKLRDLNDEFCEMTAYEKEAKKLKKDLEDFAMRDHEMWGADILQLENGSLEFVKSKVGSLVMGDDVDLLVKNLKEFFKNDSKYYLNYISVKIEPKKNEIKTAIKSGQLSEEICLANSLEIKPNEKLEIKFF